MVNDNKLLVQYTGTTPLGDQGRLNQIVSNLDGMRFAGAQGASCSDAELTARWHGRRPDLADDQLPGQRGRSGGDLESTTRSSMTLDALTQRLDSEYGVDVDEEMARLMELQNAFAANARVMSVVQELMDALMQL
jgi:flagellar hook-associated protein 1 FlgK